MNEAMTPQPLAPKVLEALRHLDACTLANAIETLHQRLRNEGFADDSIRCLFPHLPPMLGYAATIKIRGSEPPTTGGIYPDRTDWWDYVLAVPPPRVIVVEDISSRPGFGSLLGAVHGNILRALGCVGAVTNGAVRDIPALEKLAFPVFAGSISVSHAYVHIVEFGHSVQIAGLAIQSGDLLHGDLHGVQAIPLNVCGRIPEAAAKIAASESKIIALCHAPGFSVQRLREAIKESKG
jgi:4-hydroxy-4-methyl-2-oxoglutarate aldolase